LKTPGIGRKPVPGFLFCPSILDVIFHPMIFNKSQGFLGLFLILAISAAAVVAAIAIRHQDQNHLYVERPKAIDSGAQSAQSRTPQLSVESPVLLDSQPGRSPSIQTMSASPRLPVQPATVIQTQTSGVAPAPQQVAEALKRVVSQSKANSQTGASPPISNPIATDATPTLFSSQSFGSNSYRPETGSGLRAIDSSVPAAAASVQDTPTAEAGETVEIELSPGARLPAALAADSQDLPLSPAQQTIKDRIAGEFLEQVQTADPTGSSLPEWNRLAIDADERLRKLIGHDAFNRMTLSASQEALGGSQVAEQLPQQ
jgi:hypothetical protein